MKLKPDPNWRERMAVLSQRPPPKLLATADGEARRSLFQIERMHLEFANGERRHYERMSSRSLGAVIVVPMIDREHAILISEYAAGMHRYELGLPKGRLEADESIVEGGNREMMEEAGVGARQLQVIGRLALSPGYMTHVTTIVMAWDLYEKRLPGDEPEVIETMVFPLDQTFELIAGERSSEGRSIAALYMAQDYLRQHPEIMA